jgi:hypothetical protein
MQGDAGRAAAVAARLRRVPGVAAAALPFRLLRRALAG